MSQIPHSDKHFLHYTSENIEKQIQSSNYISRDLSWLQFNERVLDQAYSPHRNIFERLKFIAITASNLDEFFMIRIGSLYNYLDYDKERIDYSGLRVAPFKTLLYEKVHQFVNKQQQFLKTSLYPAFQKNGFRIVQIKDLRGMEKRRVTNYFKKTIFPMLTPMVFDNYHTFPVLRNKILVFGIVTHGTTSDGKTIRKVSFVQIPKNLPRFFEVDRNEEILFVPIEHIIRQNIQRLFRNVKIQSVNLFRITRNGDFTLDESDDMETGFVDEIRQKLKTRQTGRVVRLEIEAGYSNWMVQLLKSRWRLEDDNIFETETLIDLSALWQIVKNKTFQSKLPKMPAPVLPLALRYVSSDTIFEKIKKRDIFLHHPYNSFDTLLELIEAAAKDPNVLAIKMTIYRLAEDSRITTALLHAAEKGKHVSVLFELKARFDEENNIKEAKKLEKAGCFVIYGISQVKTHTKMVLIVRKEKEKITRYVHMSSGNYNEDTARLYTDTGLLTTSEIYARDVSEFFNVITGHSEPDGYEQLLTAPHHMRNALLELMHTESLNAKKGLESGIIIKVNSLQDKKLISALYKASQAGVPIRLIIRGICCLRPKRKGLSENIYVSSIVGDYLEHSRIFYFHNAGDPKVYTGSADAMVRSFDRRIESLFLIMDERCKKEAINLLAYNLYDNVNSYVLQEDGTYIKKRPEKGERLFNVHQEFFNIHRKSIEKSQLFGNVDGAKS